MHFRPEGSKMGSNQPCSMKFRQAMNMSKDSMSERTITSMHIMLHQKPHAARRQAIQYKKNTA